jgi:hypothetical protein
MAGRINRSRRKGMGLRGVRQNRDSLRMRPGGAKEQ